MKKHVLILSVAAFFLVSMLSCTNNGLNKPITEELSAEEIKENLKEKDDFESFYNWCRELGNWVASDNMKLAKYGNITYQKLWDVEYNLVGPEEIDAQHLALFPQREEYRLQADSILDHLASIQPDSLVELQFYYKTNVETLLGTMPKYCFFAIPLKGEVEQFNYYFYFSKNIDGEKTINDISYHDRHFGNHDLPMSKMTSIETFGGLVDVFEGVSLDELKRDYKFLYTISDIRYNGKNWNDVDYEIRDYLTVHSDNEFVHGRAKELAIRDYINNDYVPYFDFSQQQYYKILKEKEPVVFNLINEYRDK